MIHDFKVGCPVWKGSTFYHPKQRAAFGVAGHGQITDKRLVRNGKEVRMAERLEQ